MSKIIRRAPWITIGAGAAYFLDRPSGPARRRDIAERAKAWAQRRWGERQERVREEWLGRPGAGRVRPDRPWVTDGVGAEAASGDAPLVPSVSEERVRSRAGAPLAEEQAAGVADGPARAAMAEQILEESEWRVTDRAHTVRERRRSEETVETVDSAG